MRVAAAFDIGDLTLHFINIFKKQNATSYYIMHRQLV